ncbi:MAG TPA: lyase family protein [Spirochaetia bacterium]|nr:lyase family protein [Spirochaetia bacterium]
MFSAVYTERVLEPAYGNWKALYAEDAMAVHRAHLVGLAERGIVERGTAAAIARAVDAIGREFRYPERIPEGVEDLYFVFERELGERVGAERAAYLHTARSRNDMDTTVFRMALRRALAALARSALGTARAAASRARAGSAELTVLYTHGQPANVSTMGHYLEAFAADLAEDVEDLVAALGAVDRSTMGACAITGTGFPLDRRRVASLLGFAGLVENSYQAISTSHWLTRPAAATRALMGDCGRLAADLLHKASCEVGLVDFPDSLVQKSSIMPQKRNPVILEHARIQAAQAAGGCAALEDLYRNVPYQDVNEAADAPVSAFLGTLGIAESALALVAEIAAKVSSNQARAREIALRYGVTTTELADEMVRSAGIGFRTAHEICAAFVRSGNEHGALRSAFSERVGRELPFDDARIEDILSPERFVAARRTEGGPAPEGMAGAYAALESRLAGIDASLRARDGRIASAEDELASAWKALLG